MAREAAAENTTFWWLIFEGGMSYADVAKLDYEDMEEAAAALEMHIKRVNKNTEV